MREPIPSRLVSAVILAVGLGGCARQATAPQPVVLGAVYNLTGDQASLDGPSARGARLAVDEADRAGGALGRPVRLVLEDGASDTGVVAAKTAELLDRWPQTAALFGLSDTDMVLAAAPVAAARGRLFLTSGATSPELPAAVPDSLFLACFGDNVQAAAGAEWAYTRLGARTAVVLYDDSMTYTRLLHGYFTTSFTRLGGEVRSTAAYRAGEPMATHALPAADLVYLAAGPEDAAERVQQLRDAGVAAPILGGDAFDLPEVWGRHPQVERVFFTTHTALEAGATDPRSSAFRAAYAAAYDGAEPDAFAALGYDAARLLLRAVADAGSDDPTAVRRALAAVSGFEGVTGELAYRDGQRIPHKQVSVLEVAGGTTRLAVQLLPTQVPAP